MHGSVTVIIIIVIANIIIIIIIVIIILIIVGVLIVTLSFICATHCEQSSTIFLFTYNLIPVENKRKSILNSYSTFWQIFGNWAWQNSFLLDQKKLMWFSIENIITYHVLGVRSLKWLTMNSPYRGIICIVQASALPSSSPYIRATISRVPSITSRGMVYPGGIMTHAPPC